MNIYKKLINNSIVFAIGNLGAKLIILFLLPLYTYYLTPDEYGLVDLLTITVSLLIPIFTLSIINSILRFVMDENYDNETVLINSIMISLIGIMILILAYPIIVIIFPFDEYLLFFYTLIFFQVSNSLFTQYVRAKGMTRLFAFSGVLTALFLLISNIVFLIVFEWAITGYFLASILSYFLSSMFVYLAGKINRDFNVKKINFKTLKDMLIFSIPLMPNTLMWWVMGVSDRYMIAYFLGISSSGLYAVAVKIPSILNIVNSIFFQAWQMSAIEEANSEKKSQFYSNVFNVFSITMLVSTSFLLVFLKPIMSFIVADTFFIAWKYIPFLLLAVVFSSFSGFLGTNYIAAKQTGGVFKTSFIGAVINVAINLVLIPIIGINGAAIGTMISFFVVWILRIRDTRKFVSIKINAIKLTLTNLLILIQILFLYIEIRFSFFIQILLFIGIITINYKEIWMLVFKVKKVLIKIK